MYTYTCRLPDGSDLASVALLNGAARLGSDAPAVHRMQQQVALTNHRGIWANNQGGQDLASCRSATPSAPFGGARSNPLEASGQVFAYRPR